jgi:hypothetical protein
MHVDGGENLYNRTPYRRHEILGFLGLFASGDGMSTRLQKMYILDKNCIDWYA